MLLEVRGLTVRYAGAARPAVDDLSFDVAAGGSLAIVGESGSGKSTAALALTRLLDSTAAVGGDLRFEGQDLLGLSGRALRNIRGRRIGFVFQDPAASWNPTRTVGAQLLDGLRAHGLGQGARERLAALFARVGIVDPERRLREYPHQFSGGMLQRAMIAGALADEPSLLVADEPTSALDTTVQAGLLALLRELRADRTLALLMISHDLGVVSQVADQTLVLYAGWVAEQGPTDDLLAAPLHPYTWGLIASTPHLDTPRKTRLQAIRPGPVPDLGCPFAPRCPLAVEHCRSERPALRSLSGRLVSCHRAEEVPALAARGAA